MSLNYSWRPITTQNSVQISIVQPLDEFQGPSQPLAIVWSGLKWAVSSQWVPNHRKYSSCVLKNIYIQDASPPKDPYIQVRVLDDIGEVLLGDQSTSLLRNSIHFVKRTEAESLISQVPLSVFQSLWCKWVTELYWVNWYADSKIEYTCFCRYLNYSIMFMIPGWFWRPVTVVESIWIPELGLGLECLLILPSCIIRTIIFQNIYAAGYLRHTSINTLSMHLIS